MTPAGKRQEGRRRVVVTGMGIGTALGFNRSNFWARLLAGESGLRRYPSDELGPASAVLPCRVAGVVSDADLQAALTRLGLSDPDRANQLALWAVGSALEDAGWPVDGREPLPHAVIFGTGHGNAAFSNGAVAAFTQGGYRKFRPTTVVRSMFNRPANLASIRFGLTGTSFVVSCACATGAVAFGEAYLRIRYGMSDAVVAACADSGLDLATFSAWNRLGALSGNPDPAAACRPFDRARDGLVMGEGAAGLVLESLDLAEARGARILAEVVGYASTSDAHHMVQPDGTGQVRALQAALTDACLTPADIGYVNAHGTATELADRVEAESLGRVFDFAGSRPMVSNTKAQLGHLMGATAGVELVVTVQALLEQVFPGCRNVDEPDPACALPLIRGGPADCREHPVEYALKNSFAFGGTNSVVVLRRWKEELPPRAGIGLETAPGDAGKGREGA